MGTDQIIAYEALGPVLRDQFAVPALQDGVSPAYVQEQLGHSSIKLTVDTYGRWLRKKARGAVDRLDDRPPAEENGSKR